MDIKNNKDIEFAKEIEYLKYTMYEILDIAKIINTHNPHPIAIDLLIMGLYIYIVIYF